MNADGYRTAAGTVSVMLWALSVLLIAFAFAMNPLVSEIARGNADLASLY